jgi:predicted RNA-binding Zn ribbon-like protein
MRLIDRPIAAAQFVGGRLCLDFVNTCGGRNGAGEPIGERLLEFADLTAWAVRAGLESGPALLKLAEADAAEAVRVYDRAVALREVCYRLIRNVILQKPPAAGDIAILNQEWADALRHRALAPGPPYLQLKWAGGEQRLDRTLWAVAESAAQLLGSNDTGRLRQCGGVDCGWLFEDLSRNRSRQWCDMQMCGNLAKVRRFRERQTR